MMQGGAYYMLMFHEREEDLTNIVGRATKQGYDILRVNIPHEIILNGFETEFEKHYKNN